MCGSLKRIFFFFIKYFTGIITILSGGLSMTSPCSLKRGKTFLHKSQIGGNEILYSTLEALA